VGDGGGGRSVVGAIEVASCVIGCRDEKGEGLNEDKAFGFGLGVGFHWEAFSGLGVARG